MRLGRSGILVMLFAAWWPASAADGYRFLARRGQRMVVSPAQALRWDESDLPLRFRLIEDEELLPGGSARWATLRAAVERAISTWNEVPTSTLQIVLEQAAAAPDAARDANRINTVSVSPDSEVAPRVGRAYWQVVGTRIVECDIRIGSEFLLATLDESGTPSPPASLVAVVIHEFGHCFGLAHSVAHPTWLFRGFRDGGPSDFFPFRPDPFMSYGADWGDLRLTPDDEVAVSLLYPAPGFLASRGSLAGRVVFPNGRPVPFAYVQTVEYRAAGAEFGPGAFTDAWGQFLLQGLEPGLRHVWVRPLYRISAHDEGLPLTTTSLAFQHEQRWLEVGPDDTTSTPDIVVHSAVGRDGARR